MGRSKNGHLTDINEHPESRKVFVFYIEKWARKQKTAGSAYIFPNLGMLINAQPFPIIYLLKK